MLIFFKIIIMGIFCKFARWLHLIFVILTTGGKTFKNWKEKSETIATEMSAS